MCATGQFSAVGPSQNVVWSASGVRVQADMRRAAGSAGLRLTASVRLP
jgi:hypothetical protein